MIWKCIIYGGLTLALAAANGCSEGDSGAGEEVAVVETSMGDIVIAFYNDTPGHVANFKKLARDDFYNGTTFHRVIPGFMIQGGDPLSRDGNRANDGKGDNGYTQPPEFEHSHIRGAVAGARKPDQVNPKKESSGCQFYITTDPAPHLDGNYTVFGYVIEGMDVVQKISKVQRDRRNNPLKKVEIEDVTIERRVVPTSG